MDNDLDPPPDVDPELDPDEGSEPSASGPARPAPSFLVLPLSEEERLERESSLTKAAVSYRAVTAKINEASARVYEALRLIDELEAVSSSTPAVRAVRLSRKLSVPVLRDSVRKAAGLLRAASGTQRPVRRGLEEAASEILNPRLLR